MRATIKAAVCHIAFAAALAGCAVQDQNIEPEFSTPTASTLQGSEWTAVAIEGVALLSNPAPRLRWVAADQVTGSGGCNSFRGKFTIGSQGMTLGPLAATRMVCVPTPQGQEDKFFRAMELSRQAVLVRGELHFKDVAGRTLLRFQR